MASIVLLLSELLGGAGSNGVLAANCYAGGQSLREFRPVSAVVAKGERATAGEKREAAADPEGKRKEDQEESFEDLAAMSRIAVDAMWP